MAVALSVVPYFTEFAVEVGIGMRLLGWNGVDMGLLASILAALSPSLVIPGMIKMTEEKLGYTPKTVLTSAPIEVVLSIILYNIFANFEQTETNPLLPWVNVLPLWANIILIPVNILFSAVLGYVTGRVLCFYFEFRRGWGAENAHVQRIFPDSIPEFLYASIVACYTLYALCQAQYIQQVREVFLWRICFCLSACADCAIPWPVLRYQIMPPFLILFPPF